MPACVSLTHPPGRCHKKELMKPADPARFKGNKQLLPSKPCVACCRPMTWRKRWARNWDEVNFCSDACRKAAGRAGRGELVSVQP